MCYVATHPETMDEATQRQWQELARLEEAEMRTIINLECLGVPVRKHAKPYGLYFACKCKRTLPEVLLLITALVLLLAYRQVASNAAPLPDS